MLPEKLSLHPSNIGGSVWSERHIIRCIANEGCPCLLPYLAKRDVSSLTAPCDILYCNVTIHSWELSLQRGTSTYHSGYLLVITGPATNSPVTGLTIGEWTVNKVFVDQTAPFRRVGLPNSAPPANIVLPASVKPEPAATLVWRCTNVQSCVYDVSCFMRYDKPFETIS